MSNVRMWKRCSDCKTPIPLGALYWVCSVSTCNRNRTGLQFCSVSCWDAHLPIARHREAWAEERHAPTTLDPTSAAANPRRPEVRKPEIAKPAIAPRPAAPSPPLRPAQPPQPAQRRIVPTRPPQKPSATPKEILIVASRLKEFVRVESDFSTSDRVLEPLSEIVRRVCRKAIENAAADGRKTVLERDIPDF